MSKSLYIGIDFDGTCVTHAYPEIGKPIDGAIDTLQELMEKGHKLILYTMRSGERLVQARQYLEANGIELYAVNENPTQKFWTMSPKVFCNIYIDDAALGCPLLPMVGDRARVDWEGVREMLEDRGVL